MVLSRKVLESIHRLTDQDRAMTHGVLVEELPGMDIEAITMTPQIAQRVWQNVNLNKLKGLQGKGVGRTRFWACMHMLMWEGGIEGSVGKHQRDMDWDGMGKDRRDIDACTGPLECFDEGTGGEIAAQKEEGLLLLRQSLGTLEETMIVRTGPGLVEGWRRGEQVVTEKEHGDTTETEEQPNSEEEEV